MFLPGNVPGGVRVQAHPIVFEGVEVVLVDAEALVVLRRVFAGRLKHDEGVEDDGDKQVQKDTKHHDEKPKKKQIRPRPRPTIARVVPMVHCPALVGRHARRCFHTAIPHDGDPILPGHDLKQRQGRLWKSIFGKSKYQCNQCNQ